MIKPSPQQRQPRGNQTEQRERGRLRHFEDLPAKLAVRKRGGSDAHIPKAALQFVDLSVGERKRSRPEGRACRTAEAIKRRVPKAATTMKYRSAQIKDYWRVDSGQSRTLDVSAHGNECNCWHSNQKIQHISVKPKRSCPDGQITVGRHFVRPGEDGFELNRALGLRWFNSAG